MSPLLSFRRIKVLLSRSGTKRRDRVPQSLQDCLERPTSKKSGLWKIILSAWLLGAVLFYLFCNQAATVPPVPYLEVFPENDVEAVTEQVTLADVFSYEKYPPKAKAILAQTQNSLSPTAKNEVIALSRILEQREKLPLCVSREVTRNVTIKKKIKNLDGKLDLITIGGYYAPRECRSRHKVGILVPYRGREENLAVFLYNIHPFLIQQSLEYRIFVIEQYGKDLFNRGRLFNAGFHELEKMGDWPCVIFHDVDLLPTDDRILYTCPNIPRHMCAAVLQDTEQLPSYRSLFGGVAAMTAGQYKKVNGYSNMYWGWGGEDNDMFWRLKITGLGVTRYSKKIARYAALPHKTTPVNQYRYQMLKTAMNRYKDDGLSSVQYTVVSYQIRQLYTHILVDINPWKENITKLVMSFNN